jgi:hypothetical protein
MKKITLLFGVLTSFLISPQLKAQDSIFDLKNYKTTNYERSSLDIVFDLNETGNGSSYRINNIDYKEEHNYNNGELNLQSNYLKTVFLKEKIVNYGLSLSVDEGFSKSTEVYSYDTVFRDNKNLGYHGALNLSGNYDLNFYYAPSNKNFLIVGGNASIGQSNSYRHIERTELKAIEEEKGNNFQSVINLNLGHGHGRIENIEDAVEAIYILKELSDNGLLSRKYTEVDIKEFADKITLVKKERFFDERLYRQKSMKTMVEFLEETGLTDKTGVNVFNTIADYHYYAGIETRPSGKKLQYYLTPSLSSSMETSPTTVNDISYQLDENHLIGKLVVSTEYYNYKPISIKWQRNFYARASVSKSWDRKELDYHSANITYDNPYKTKTYYGNVQINYSYGYYPNTRTYINARLAANYNLEVDQPGEAIKNYFNGGLSISSYYYLSSKLRLSGNFNLTANINSEEYAYSVNSTNTRKNIYLNNNLALALTYYIF